MPPMSAEPTSPPDDAWREPLIQSLRECALPQEPRRKWWRLFVALLFSSAFALVGLVVGAIANARNTPPDVRIVITVGWFIFAVVVLARVRNRLYRRYWQARSRGA